MSTFAGIRQWFRVARLVVGSGGEGIDVSNLRISFEIIKTVEPVPNTATIKIYNLHDDNVAALQTAYSDVLLNAGYAEGVAQIFAGNIQFVSHYRDGTDYITEITAADGDRDYRNSFINETLAAGTTDADAISKIRATMPKTREGPIQTVGKARSRGKVLTGPSRDVLTQIARANGANWSIQDGQLQVVRADSKLDVAVVVNYQTGLLEAPERNDKGVAVKCLLNPAIVINGAVKLENQSIRIKQQKQKVLKTQKREQPPVRLDPDGVYKVIKLTHEGDTRSNEWFTIVECISLGQPIATSGTLTTAKAVPLQGYSANPINPMMWNPVNPINPMN